MDDRKYCKLIISSLEYMMKNYPELSFGEIMYSFLRKECLKVRPDNINNSWMLNVSDKEFYKAIECAIETEVEINSLIIESDEEE